MLFELTLKNAAIAQLLSQFDLDFEEVLSILYEVNNLAVLGLNELESFENVL